jgi:ribosomal protein S18 acetylase RimI-like enzyme
VHQPRYTIALTPADVGERVMVRYALVVGLDPYEGPPPEAPLTDAVGDLLAWEHDRLHIATRTATVEVAEAALVAAKRVPPARLARALDASIPEVQRMSALSWQATETERMGGWRLRAGGGFTGRANSVLPLGRPGIPYERAIDYVERWYGERGLTPRFQLPLPFALELADVLDARGWPVVDSADVMVGDVAAVLEVAGEPRWDLPSVEVLDVPTPAWLGAYHYRGSALPAAGHAVLTHHDRAGFASVVDEGNVVAIVRGAVDPPWVGLSAVEVDPGHRRRGLGRHVVTGLLRWAHEQGARYAHLQVAAGNQAGKALYGHLGFAFHHRYDYRTAP